MRQTDMTASGGPIAWQVQLQQVHGINVGVAQVDGNIQAQRVLQQAAFSAFEFLCNQREKRFVPRTGQPETMARHWVQAKTQGMARRSSTPRMPRRRAPGAHRQERRTRRARLPPSGRGPRRPAASGHRRWGTAVRRAQARCARQGKQQKAASSTVARGMTG